MEMLSPHPDYDKIVRDMIQIAREVSEQLYDKYNYPNGAWFPCGNAHLVLNGTSHRKLVNFLKKTLHQDGDKYWTGDYGSLMKLSGRSGYWWSLPFQDSQSMNYKEAVYQTVRNYVADKYNLAIEVGSYID